MILAKYKSAVQSKDKETLESSEYNEYFETAAERHCERHYDQEEVVDYDGFPAPKPEEDNHQV